MESHKRSVAKAVSWRVIATGITSAIAWLLTGEWQFAATIGLVDTTIKFFVYFCHERVWNRLAYGREEQSPEYMI